MPSPLSRMVMMVLSSSRRLPIRSPASRPQISFSAPHPGSSGAVHENLQQFVSITADGQTFHQLLLDLHLILPFAAEEFERRADYGRNIHGIDLTRVRMGEGFQVGDNAFYPVDSLLHIPKDFLIFRLLFRSDILALFRRVYNPVVA